MVGISGKKCRKGMSKELAGLRHHRGRVGMRLAPFDSGEFLDRRPVIVGYALQWEGTLHEPVEQAREGLDLPVPLMLGREFGPDRPLQALVAPAIAKRVRHFSGREVEDRE